MPKVEQPFARQELVVPQLKNDLSGLDMGFQVIEGFSRPDWKLIRQFVKSQILRGDESAVWTNIAAKWLSELASDLGGQSQLYQSQHFICLSDSDDETAERILNYGEECLGLIRGCLGRAAWSGYHGKHVLLLFSEIDDYYSYISYFDPDGRHILSGGTFLGGGYAHLAIPVREVRSVQQTLVHELTHNLLCHLVIPLWLNEGLAQLISDLAANQDFILERDLVQRHRNFWNEQNIQAFWAGVSFNVPGDESELSYDLGRIFVRILSDVKLGFDDFIATADWRDGGFDAAAGCLGKDLGEVAAGFLGPGNWRPQRKAIRELLEKKPPETNNEPSQEP